MHNYREFAYHCHYWNWKHCLSHCRYWSYDCWHCYYCPTQKLSYGYCYLMSSLSWRNPNWEEINMCNLSDLSFGKKTQSGKTLKMAVEGTLIN